MSVRGTHDSRAQPKGSGSTGNSSGSGRSTCSSRSLNDKAGPPRPLGGRAREQAPPSHPRMHLPCPAHTPGPHSGLGLPGLLARRTSEPLPLGPKAQGTTKLDGSLSRQGEWRDTDRPPSLQGDSEGTVNPRRPSPREAHAAKNAGGGRVPGPRDTPVLSPALPGRSGVHRDRHTSSQVASPQGGGCSLFTHCQALMSSSSVPPGWGRGMSP